MLADPIAEQQQHPDRGEPDEPGEAEDHSRSADNEAAQQRPLAARRIRRHQPQRRLVQAERGNKEKHVHPGPCVGEDAELERSGAAGDHHLHRVGESDAEHLGRHDQRRTAQDSGQAAVFAERADDQRPQRRQHFTSVRNPHPIRCPFVDRQIETLGYGQSRTRRLDDVGRPQRSAAFGASQAALPPEPPGFTPRRKRGSVPRAPSGFATRAAGIHSARKRGSVPRAPLPASRPRPAGLTANQALPLPLTGADPSHRHRTYYPRTRRIVCDGAHRQTWRRSAIRCGPLTGKHDRVARRHLSRPLADGRMQFGCGTVSNPSRASCQGDGYRILRADSRVLAHRDDKGSHERARQLAAEF